MARKLVDQRTCDVAEAPVIQSIEVRMGAPPGELDELVVNGAAQQHGIAIRKVLGKLVELDDLGRADEGEILRVEVDDLPLAWKRCFGDGFEGGLAAFFVIVEARLHTSHGKCFDGLTYGFHELLLSTFLRWTDSNGNGKNDRS